MSSPSASAAAVKPDDDANSSGSGEMRPRAVNVWPAIDGERKDPADTKKASRRSPSESRDDDKSDEGDRHRSRHHRDGDRSRRYHDKHRSPRRHDRDRSPRRHDRDRSRSPKRHHDRRRSSYDRRRRDGHEDRYDSDRRHNRSDRRHDDRPHRRSSDHDRHRDRDHRDRRDSRGHDRKDDRDDDKERDEKRHHRDEQRDSGMSQHAQDKELDQSPSLQQRPDTTADQGDDVKKIDEEKPETNSAGPVAAETGIEKKPALRLKMKLKNQPEKRKVSKLEEQAMEILAAEKKGLQGAGTSSAGAIEVVLNDRLGTKTRVKCLKTDTVGQLKQLIAVQVGVRPEKIRLQKWYTVFKDHITLDAYEVLDGMSLELYYN